MDERMKETIKRTEDELAYCRERNFTTCLIRIEDISYLLRKVNELIEENKRLRILSTKQDEYLKLLADEISDLVGLASVHGWKSIRYERGEKFRKEIACLRDESPNAGYKSLREV